MHPDTDRDLPPVHVSEAATRPHVADALDYLARTGNDDAEMVAMLGLGEWA